MFSRISATFFRNTALLPTEESTRLNVNDPEGQLGTPPSTDHESSNNGNINGNNNSTYGSFPLASENTNNSNNHNYEELPAPVPGDSSTDDDDDDDDDDSGDHDEPDDDDDVTQAGENPVNSDDVDDALTTLTRRLRCLFSVVTWPIVPLGSICIIGLIWLLYSSFIIDINKTCSHPLHWYSVLSSGLLIYLPFHTSIRSYLFQYDRDRDGPNRPASVRRYDQCFNTIALLYVYAGITIVQTCRDDALPMEAGSNMDTSNTCAATCPSTYSSLRLYIACLELFVLSLVVPLLFLPCLYLYFVRRTFQDAEALSVLQDRLREEEALRRNGGITAEEIMEYFEIVNLVVDPRTTDRKVLIMPRPVQAEDGQVGSSIVDYSTARECDTKECCICMKSFKVGETGDVEAGQILMPTLNDQTTEDHIVRTSRTCSHLFHRRCISSWVGGRWEAGSNPEQRPARHTTCPLCRRDFRPNR